MRKITAILLTAFLSITLASCSDKPAKTAISEIILSSNSVEVQMGESIQLSVSILPSSAELPELSWSSSNSAIATVDDTGCVTGISAGQTNVIVEGENNTYTVCSVTVKEKTAYERLTERERQFVDAFLKIVDKFYNPPSVTLKYIYYSSASSLWDITVSAENQMGGYSEKDFILYENGDFIEPILPHVIMPGEDKWYDLNLINAAIDERIG